MKPATFAQQAAYDACMDIAKTLQSGREATPQQFAAARDTLALLRLEPQPEGFVEMLELLQSLVAQLCPPSPGLSDNFESDVAYETWI